MEKQRDVLRKASENVEFLSPADILINQPLLPLSLVAKYPFIRRLFHGDKKYTLALLPTQSSSTSSTHLLSQQSTPTSSHLQTATHLVGNSFLPQTNATVI